MGIHIINIKDTRIRVNRVSRNRTITHTLSRNIVAGKDIISLSECFHHSLVKSAHFGKCSDERPPFVPFDSGTRG